MDLQEIVSLQSNRHPWEKVRAKFIQKILGEFVPTSSRVLDVGCGDGFIAEQLVKKFSITEYIGFDINLSSSQIYSYNRKNSQVTFINNNKDIAEKLFDLVLLLDVLEHIEDDGNFVKKFVLEHLDKNSKMLITVPAFPSLYSSHDSFLEHHRRYTQKQLQGIVKSAHCKTLATGYMFASLLPVRALSVFLQKISLKQKPDYSGIGQWNGSRLLSTFIEHALTIDNKILFSASKSGILIPGLTLWTLCEKQQ